MSLHSRSFQLTASLAKMDVQITDTGDSLVRYNGWFYAGASPSSNDLAAGCFLFHPRLLLTAPHQTKISIGDNSLDRRDASRRRAGDENYDPKTLYLPPDFVKSLTGGQRQWWEFKSKYMDKVLFFKMGKFYELFEMDAHIGAKELELQYMKGVQPHCGFPEKNFSMHVEKLARKVVKREICAVITKGTLIDGEMLSVNPDASYLMSVTEHCDILPNQQRIFGVCVTDVSTSKIILGQFVDDYECSALSCLLTELRPAEIIKPSKQFSPETERMLMRYTRSP